LTVSELFLMFLKQESYRKEKKIFEKDFLNEIDNINLIKIYNKTLILNNFL